jgi:1-acyl-sn-glycerol-3-phosphate acyltransferase
MLPEARLRSDPLPPGASRLADLRGARRALGVVETVLRLVFEAQAEPGAQAPALALRAQRTARTLLTRHCIEVRQAGATPPPRAILVANHLSYLDPLVMASIVPCIAIAKSETQDWPLFGAGLQALGVVFVRRGDAYGGAIALRRAWRALDLGATVLNFPEGTTGDGCGVGPFRHGIFGLARIARAPVIPARIAYEDDRVPWFGAETLGPHYWRLSRIARVVADVRFGEPIAVDRSDDPRALASHAHCVVDALRCAH